MATYHKSDGYKAQPGDILITSVNGYGEVMEAWRVLFNSPLPASESVTRIWNPGGDEYIWIIGERVQEYEKPLGYRPSYDPSQCLIPYVRRGNVWTACR